MKKIAFLIGFVAGGLLALVYADVINVAILKTIPRKPPEMEDDPFAEPYGETWRYFPQ